MTAVKVFAPAKINLTLHVTGQRDDGYHFLDTLVVFADVGDWITLKPASQTTRRLEGPECHDLPVDGSNIVQKAISTFSKERAFDLTLNKLLPVSSGIGGGSADAAATVRGLQYLQNSGTSILLKSVLDLGADVPMCMESRPCHVQGIGEQIKPFTSPNLHAVLANARVPVSTPSVFRALTSKSNAPMSDVPDSPNSEKLIEWLQDQRNDLKSAAIEIAPAIAKTLSALQKTKSCALSRMSGSGATCFGLFPTEEAAKTAAQTLQANYPQWWIKPTILGDMSERATPVTTGGN